MPIYSAVARTKLVEGGVECYGYVLQVLHSTSVRYAKDQQIFKKVRNICDSL